MIAESVARLCCATKVLVDRQALDSVKRDMSDFLAGFLNQGDWNLGVCSILALAVTIPQTSVAFGSEKLSFFCSFQMLTQVRNESKS